MNLWIWMIIGIAIGCLIFGAYRLYKMLQRRCLCGSIFVRRIKKRRPNPDIYPSDQIPACPMHQQTFIFGECRSCKEFSLVKSENKCFIPWELTWREVFHPHETDDVEACLIRAGIEQPPETDPPAPPHKPRLLPPTPLNVHMNPSLQREQAERRRAKGDMQMRITTPTVTATLSPH